jgi:hypothetical protein
LATERRAAPVRKLSAEHRLGDGELSRLLGRKADAPLASGARRGQYERLAVEVERAAGWWKQIGQYLEERRPPRTILADDRLDATGMPRAVNTLQHRHDRVAFGDRNSLKDTDRLCSRRLPHFHRFISPWRRALLAAFPSRKCRWCRCVLNVSYISAFLR